MILHAKNAVGLLKQIAQPVSQIDNFLEPLLMLVFVMTEHMNLPLEYALHVTILVLHAMDHQIRSA